MDGLIINRPVLGAMSCIVVSGPSGAGKSTLIKRLIATDDKLRFSVSYTTREMRAGEKNGVDYHFVDRNEFERLASENFFVEYEEYDGNLYGTPRKETDGTCGICIFDLDKRGVLSMKRIGVDAIYVLITCPRELVKERLTKRAQKVASPGCDTVDIENRLRVFDQIYRDMESIRKENLYDIVINNVDLDKATAELINAVKAALH